MAWRKSVLAAAATAMVLFASSAAGAASDTKPHIYPLSTVPQWEASAALVLTISPSTMYAGPTQFVVFPLTSVNGANQTAPVSVSLQGNLAEATLKNFATIGGSDQIALMACDPLNATFIDPDSMLSVVMDNNPTAVLLYSETGAFCNMLNPSSDFQNIFTMATKNDTAMLRNVTESGATVAAFINSSDTLSGSDPGSGSGPGGNSTVAMSILYSITGLITVLFMIIIATGAMRAHRYPERYGPRGATAGRPRQSRAKGIARAMLETLPIVKFGDNTTAKPDPGLELESGAVGSHQASTDASGSDSATPPNAAAAAAHPSAAPAGSDGTQAKTAGADTSAVGGAVGAATGSTDERKSSDETPSCSICTEDFTVGEDVRVLPCNHKFHPNCVDPWLVNVSGTCPLCRLDLRPSAPEGEEQPDNDDANMPPPLGADEAAGTAGAAAGASGANAHHRRGPARFLDFNRLRHASVEERLEALRRYRAEHHMINRRTTGSVAVPPAAAAAEASETAEPAAAESDDDHGRAARLTRRLRDKFRIKTHAQTQPPSSGPGSA